MANTVKLNQTNTATPNLPPAENITNPQKSKGSQVASRLNDLLGVAVGASKTYLDGETQRNNAARLEAERIRQKQAAEYKKTMAEYKKLQDAKINADVVRQTARAGYGATQDAQTAEGQDAYNIVGSRNDLVQAFSEGDRLAETLDWAGDPEGSQTVMEDYYANSVEDIIKSSGGNTVVSNGIGGMAAGMMPAAYDRIAKLKQDKIITDRHDRLVDSFLIGSDKGVGLEQKVSNINEVLYGDSKPMGMSTEEAERSLVDAAIFAATRPEPDTTLIESAMALGLDKRYPGMEGALRQANSTKETKAVGSIASYKENLIAKYQSMPINEGSKEEFFKEAGESEYPVGTKLYKSPEAIRSEWNKIAKEKQEVDLSYDRFTYAMTSMVDPSMTPPSVRYGSLSKKERQSIYSQLGVVEAGELVAAKDRGAEQDELYAIMTMQHNRRNDFTKASGWLDPQLQGSVTGLFTADTQSMTSPSKEDQRVPSGVGNVMATVAQFNDDPTVLMQYQDGEKAWSLYRNFELNKQNMDELSAYKVAMRQTTESRKLEDKELTKLNKEAESAIKDKMTYYFSENTPRGERSRVTQEVKDRARSMYATNRGNMTEADAVEFAWKEYEGSHMEVSSGVWVKGSMTSLALQMSTPEARVNPLNVQDIISSAPTKIAEGTLLPDSGYFDLVINQTVPPEDWIPRVTNDGHIYFADEYGAPITRRLELQELNGISVDERYKQEKSSKKKLDEDYQLLGNVGL